MELAIPDPSLVVPACEQFEKESGPAERALSKLFHTFPSNDTLEHVLLKVVTLNTLYSTQIPLYSNTRPTLEDLTNQIFARGTEIDALLAEGSTTVVDRIARIFFRDQKEWCYYSFATKYCSWHQPEKYPIWDSLVDRYLYLMQRQHPFTDKFVNAALWDYPRFKTIMLAFRSAFGLEKFTFKQIDAFLIAQSEAAALASSHSTESQSTPQPPLQMPL